MDALTSERLSRMIDTARGKVAALPESEVTKLDGSMAVSFQEHFKFQELQARYHVSGLLTPEAAQIVYVALGEVGSESNGGWAKGTDTATKVIVTQLMGELLKLSINQRRGMIAKLEKTK